MLEDDRPTEAMLPLERPDSARETIAMPPLFADTETRASVPDEDRVLAGYVVEHEIGRGGTGVVYAATHPVVGRPFAVKVLAREVVADASTVERFLAEARAVDALQHEHIVRTIDFGILADGRRYHVMELLVGESLRARIRRGPVPVDEAMRYVDECASALGAAHAAGIVHRDLKADNVFVHAPEGATPQCKLLDFGFGVLLDAAGANAARAIVGTPAYMSPEQARAPATVDGRTDIYALGVLAHYLITGQLPYQADNPLDMLIAHVEAPIPTLDAVVPEVPRELAALVAQMLAKHPDDRPTIAKIREVIARGGADEVPLLDEPTGVDAIPRRALTEDDSALATGPTVLGGVVTGMDLPQLPVEDPPPEPPRVVDAPRDLPVDDGPSVIVRPSLAMEPLSRDLLAAMPPHAPARPAPAWLQQRLATPPPMVALPPRIAPPSTGAESQTPTVQVAPLPKPASPMVAPPPTVTMGPAVPLRPVLIVIAVVVAVVIAIALAAH